MQQPGPRAAPRRRPTRDPSRDARARAGAVGCAKCCSVFASTGVVFLCFIGSLLNRQPLYVRGPAPRTPPPRVAEHPARARSQVVGVDHPATAAKQCFAAAWIYITIVVISVVVLAYDKILQRDRPNTGYRGMPEYGAISYKNEL